MNDQKQLDVNRLRLSQDFANKIGVRKAIITVPVRKPDRQWFVRVHPDSEWRLETAVLELKDERQTYLVDPELWSELPGGTGAEGAVHRHEPTGGRVRVARATSWRRWTR